MSLTTLNRDALFLTLSRLDLPSLASLCKSSSGLNQLCTSHDFWVFKYTFDFGEAFPAEATQIPRITYLRRKQQALLADLARLKNRLRERVANILISSASPDEKARMLNAATKVYPATIDHYLTVGTTLEEMRSALEHPNLDAGWDDFLEAVVTDLQTVLGSSMITYLNGFDLESHDYAGSQTGAEFLAQFAKAIIRELMDYKLQADRIEAELDSLFQMLSLNPFKGLYRYMRPDEIYAIEDIGTANVLTGWDPNRDRGQIRLASERYSFDFPPVQMDDSSSLSPLAGIPPPAPILSTMTPFPRPLPANFPDPFPPAPPGSVVPPGLPPAPR